MAHWLVLWTPPNMLLMKCPSLLVRQARGQLPGDPMVAQEGPGKGPAYSKSAGCRGALTQICLADLTLCPLFASRGSSGGAQAGAAGASYSAIKTGFNKLAGLLQQFPRIQSGGQKPGYLAAAPPV
eukprot:1161629-Pelagomonas_calceolata.AAC.2